MCPFVCFTACVRSTGTFDLDLVKTCVFILYLCRACWLLNILSGHVKCERNRAQDVQPWPSACSQSTHSLSHLHARSLIFVSSLPLSSRLCLRHCTATHDIMGLLLCHFVKTVTTAHSALIRRVFVLRHHVKFAFVHTFMWNRVTMWLNPVMLYLLCTKVTYSLNQTQNEFYITSAFLDLFFYNNLQDFFLVLCYLKLFNIIMKNLKWLRINTYLINAGLCLHILYSIFLNTIFIIWTIFSALVPIHWTRAWTICETSPFVFHVT